MDTYFKIFSNCLVVRGHTRSTIIDLQREFVSIIPNTMVEIIELFQNKIPIDSVYKTYGEENSGTIKEYINYLVENEFGFITDSEEFELFIPMDYRFEIPAAISNCIFEISDHPIALIEKTLKSLNQLNCKYIQLIAYETIPLKKLKNILFALNAYDLKSIELVLKYNNSLFKFIDQIDSSNFKITKLILHSSNNKNKVFSNTTFEVQFLDYKLQSFKNCGIVDRKYFTVSKEKVLESLHYNSCLHKKVAIDHFGNIKNCPAMPESYGNINDTTLEEAIEHPEFKKYWSITKDEILKCKDCEFRQVCTDCRAFVEVPENHHSKPLKCGYDPYTGKWEEWSTNPLKKKVLAHYGMPEIIKNKI